MAWRLESAVTHGEIDNTVEGLTTGRIWLAGRDEPLELTLDGDCWRDLAGTRLRFTHSDATALPDGEKLDSCQKGLVGDMTASRKNKVPSVGEDEMLRRYEAGEDVPFEWRNTLYLEWFSTTNGRVVIESTDYLLEISGHEWEMDEDAEEAQKLANLNSMRDFMAQVIQRREPSPDDPVSGEMNEFEWEERLKESDRLTDAYQEVLEKYMEDPDSERKEAFVMGWDGLLDALAERDEGESSYRDDEHEDFEAAAEQGFECGGDGEGLFDESFGDDDEDEEDDHPLQIKAQELALRAMDVVDREAGPGSASYVLVSNLLQVSGKLAAALNGRGSGYEPEAGYVLAMLKRCLNWLNEAVGACQELMAQEEDADQLAALAHLRCTAFEIRDGITELRRELKS